VAVLGCIDHLLCGAVIAGWPCFYSGSGHLNQAENIGVTPTVYGNGKALRVGLIYPSLIP
jgi:hypothetical protein